MTPQYRGQRRTIAIAAGAKGYGRGGIRTHGTLLTYTHFPGVRLKPLGHPSPHLVSVSHRIRRASGLAVGWVLAASFLLIADYGRLRSVWYSTRYYTDRERFELSIPGSPVCRFSRPVPSTTRPPVQQPVKLFAEDAFFNPRQYPFAVNASEFLA
jgi:hypothetical protein